MSTDEAEKKARQTWETPQDFFNILDSEVGGFDIDVAGDAFNSKCQNFIDEANDALSLDWFWKLHLKGTMDKAWCNPPYNNPVLWVDKAIEQVNAEPGAVVYMLLNHDASTKWYSQALENASEIRILTKKRVQFIAPDGITPSSNSKAQCVIVFRRKLASAPCHVWHWDWAKDLEAFNDGD